MGEYVPDRKLPEEIVDRGPCPNCGASWVGAEIPEEHREDFGGKTHFGRVIGIEYPERYDGIWEWECPDCQRRFPRFDRSER